MVRRGPLPWRHSRRARPPSKHSWRPSSRRSPAQVCRAISTTFGVSSSSSRPPIRRMDCPPERPIDPAARRSRSIDVELERIGTSRDRGHRDRRSPDRRRAPRCVASPTRLQRSGVKVGGAWTVSGLLVLRATRRNRGLVREFADLFDARFPAPSAGVPRRDARSGRGRCLARMGSSGRAWTARGCSPRGSGQLQPATRATSSRTLWVEPWARARRGVGPGVIWRERRRQGDRHARVG